MHAWTYIYTHICLYACIYIYILYTYIHIYICVDASNFLDEPSIRGATSARLKDNRFTVRIRMYS